MTSIHHIGITCKNIKQSEEFYVKHFGFIKTKEAIAPAKLMQQLFGISSPAKLVYLECENKQLLELFEFPEAKNLNPSMGSISHISLSVRNRDEVAKRLKATGVEIKTFTKDNGDYIYFSIDPDGVMIELKD